MATKRSQSESACLSAAMDAESCAVRLRSARQDFPVEIVGTTWGRTRHADIQFPLDQGFDVVEAHGGVRVCGAEGVESRPIAIFIQAGQRFLAGFGCDGGLSESEGGSVDHHGPS